MTDYTDDVLDKGAEVLASRLGTDRDELGQFWEELRDDVRGVLDAVGHDTTLRLKLDVSQQVAAAALKADRKHEKEIRDLRAQTARDAATIKQLQDLSTARLESHTEALRTLTDEIHALRRHIRMRDPLDQGAPTETEKQRAAKADGFPLVNVVPSDLATVSAVLASESDRAREAYFTDAQALADERAAWKRAKEAHGA